MSHLGCSRAMLAALLLIGCEDPLKAAQVLEEPRILGVRLVAAGDQSSLEPGQDAELEVLLAGPEGMLSARLAYQLCEAAESERGVPYCAGTAFTEATVDLDGTPIPLAVPSEVEPGARLAVLGVACLDAEPELAPDPIDWSCSDGQAGLRFSFDARSSSPDVVNLNPDLSQVSLSISGVAVQPTTGRPANCDGGNSIVAADAMHQVSFELGEGAREAGESLQLSHFSSRGHFERHYSFVAPEKQPEARLSWRAPHAGTTLQQYLVVRDGRGGVSWLSFSLCAD
ncbi:MAG TPA: hypothetical protein VEX18_07255 [Polyangiaceae bacterium]|nr:hypothetical protein [Polyangiaceae bacterium]